MAPPATPKSPAFSVPYRSQGVLTGRVTKSSSEPPSSPCAPGNQNRARIQSPSKTAKYGLCPVCRIGRRVRSRFHPKGTSPFPGKWRFVCSNRIVPSNKNTSNNDSGSSSSSSSSSNGQAMVKQSKGCTYTEVLDFDPMKDPFLQAELQVQDRDQDWEQDRDQGQYEQTPTSKAMRKATAKENSAGSTRRWRQSVLFAERQAGTSSGDKGRGEHRQEANAPIRDEDKQHDNFGSSLGRPRQDVPQKGVTVRPNVPMGKASERAEGPDEDYFDDLGPEDEKELASLAEAASQHQDQSQTLADAFVDDFDEEDEVRLIELADKASMMDEFDEEDEACLIELADKASSASLPTRRRLFGT
ncbi:hypothetical protein N656DRAFT_56652 [Canariomyces notabilis]|uniref:Uncharacterized protein n=1 Tax=Canariomyces notabilis TaxID=2074819 RepID=A0AAN6YXT6_9PEZI|nr:hypothetical protein N656DRAFT_56652 [Canariomyces arenarius]